MRNQYKVLAEKYELVLEANTEQPAQQGREIKGVFVPTEVENWIDNGLQMPVWKAIPGKTGHTLMGTKITSKDYIKKELEILVNKLYLKYRDYTPAMLEPLKQGRAGGRIRGVINSALANARKEENETPEEKEKRLKYASINTTKRKDLRNKKLVQGSPYDYIRDVTLGSCLKRCRAKGLLFFPDIIGNIAAEKIKDVNFDKVSKTEALNKIAEALLPKWPENNLCPVLGLVLKPNTTGKSVSAPSSPSLDKFYPEKGYTLNNVYFISHLANQIKNNGTLEQVKIVRDYVYIIMQGPEAIKENFLDKIKNHVNGYTKELITPVGKMTASRSAAKNRANDQGVYFDENNLTIEYLRSIFPLDMICPVFGTKMQWNTQTGPTNVSPALDKIITSVGYTPGNVIYISHQANTIKGNATLEQINRVYEWMKQQINNNNT
jgi:hypothetical protein